MQQVSQQVSQQVVHQHRPLPVWLILVFYILFSGAGLLLLAQALSDPGSLGTDLQRRFAPMALSDVVWIVCIQLLPLIGATALFMLMKVARLIFAAYALLLAGGIAWRASTTSLAAAVAAHGLPGTLIALAAGAAVCHYAWRLGRQGLLR